MKQVEIYALCDPDTQHIRYIGKANDSKKRFKTHLLDMNRRNTPVYQWMRVLAFIEKIPVMRVLSVVTEDKWIEEEIRLIALYRSKGPLLNVANGGDQPKSNPKQNSINGHKLVKYYRDNPLLLELRKLKADTMGDYKRGYLNESHKQRMRELAIKYPNTLGTWRNIK